MELRGTDDFTADEIEKINSLPGLDILAIVAAKVWEKEGFGVGSRKVGPSLELPMSEKKRLPFDLNLKPRSCRKPRSNPIHVEALFPCLHKKRGHEEEEEDVKPPTPKRLKIIFCVRAPAPQAQFDLPAGSDPELVIQKSLFEADVETSEARLTMPCRQCKVNFGDIGEMKDRMIYKGIDNELREMMMTFKKWDTVSSYMFNGNTEDSAKRKKNGQWNELVMAMGLKTGDVVQVWSTRVWDQPSFALVKL